MPENGARWLPTPDTSNSSPNRAAKTATRDRGRQPPPLCNSPHALPVRSGRAVRGLRPRPKSQRAVRPIGHVRSSASSCMRPIGHVRRSCVAVVLTQAPQRPKGHFRAGRARGCVRGGMMGADGAVDG